ncbi:MAG: CotH kinase family protein [Anaerolineae bacterium]|nr:CotH kinase family protein [Anaerolineae bacterium]
MPGFSLPSGYYAEDIQIKLYNPRDDATVIFTLDGCIPTPSTATTYTHPIQLFANTQTVAVIRARLLFPGGDLGPVTSASYVMGLPTSLPVLSLVMEPNDLLAPEYGICTNPNEKGNLWERNVEVIYIGENHNSGFQMPAGIRIHGHGSREFDKKSFRLYFRKEYGEARLEYPLFEDCAVDSFKRLVLYSGAQDGCEPWWWKWTLVRNQLAAELAFEIGGYAVQSQPVLLFINGEPWGIYYIREHLDRFFLDDHYGITNADFLEAPEVPGQSEAIMGERYAWDKLLEFVETHDLTIPENYAYVGGQIDIQNFVNYNILQIYSANADWPDHNIHQFRPHLQGGQWQWIFWDSDRAFGAGHYTTDMLEHLLEYKDPYTQGRDSLLLRQLWKNPAFLQRFLQQTADMLNTTLTSESVISHIDRLSAQIEPDILYETLRWSGSKNWAANVQELRDFAKNRPDVVRQHVVEHFGLQGTATLTFTQTAEGHGTVAINGQRILAETWQGVYFQGVPVEITAVPDPGYQFTSWEPASLPQEPVITLTVAITQTITPHFIKLDDDVPHPGDVIFIRESLQTREGRIELYVNRSGGIDLRGWRITDNDTKVATDEGSLIFGQYPILEDIPKGTTISIVLPETPGVQAIPPDDLTAWDRHITLYVGNGLITADTDPGFNLGKQDNLVLLAPGATADFDDDRGIDFFSNVQTVTPASFGVLVDGIAP